MIQILGASQFEHKDSVKGHSIQVAESITLNAFNDKGNSEIRIIKVIYICNCNTQDNLKILIFDNIT